MQQINNLIIGGCYLFYRDIILLDFFLNWYSLANKWGGLTKIRLTLKWEGYILHSSSLPSFQLCLNMDTVSAAWLSCLEEMYQMMSGGVLAFLSQDPEVALPSVQDGSTKVMPSPSLRFNKCLEESTNLWHLEICFFCSILSLPPEGISVT